MELPSFLSNRTLVEVHMFFSPRTQLEQKNGLEIKVEVPVHARYQVSLKELSFSPFTSNRIFSRKNRSGAIINRCPDVLAFIFIL